MKKATLFYVFVCLSLCSFMCSCDNDSGDIVGRWKETGYEAIGFVGVNKPDLEYFWVFTADGKIHYQATDVAIDGLAMAYSASEGVLKTFLDKEFYLNNQSIQMDEYLEDRLDDVTTYSYHITGNRLQLTLLSDSTKSFCAVGKTTEIYFKRAD